jgi:alpha-mannosidase
MKIMRFIGIVLALFSAGSPPAAQAQDSGKKYKVYMVSNSHLDTQWRWDVKATIDDYLYNTAVQNLALLEKYPHYVFNFEGAVKYEWIKEYYPHLFDPEIRSRRAMEHFGGFVRGQRPEHAVVGVVYPQHPACTGVL